MKILVVDDSKAMRLIVKRTLRQAGLDGHEINEAVNGAEALKAIQADPPDLVLSDWNMPEMNGLELLQALRKDGTFSGKFGFVTTEGSPDMRRTAVENGALFLITKPFTADMFTTILGPLLA